MIIDSHAHVVLPIEKHIALMDEARVDKTILFSTSIHPEEANNINEFEKEMNSLYEIISGKRNSHEVKIASTKEEYEIINKYPSRFQGFGSVPVGLDYEKTASWIEEYVIKIAKETKNVYIDLSASYAAVALKMTIKELPERCLFSSDLPYGDLVTSKFAIERVCKDKIIIDQVLGGNIAKLLKL